MVGVCATGSTPWGLKKPWGVSPRTAIKLEESISESSKVESKALTQGIRVPFRPYPGRILSGVEDNFKERKMGFPTAGQGRDEYLKTSCYPKCEWIHWEGSLGGADAKTFGICFPILVAPVQPAFASPDLQRLAQYASAIGQSNLQGNKKRGSFKGCILTFKGINPNLTTKYNE